jgi:hypothetical protein
MDQSGSQLAGRNTETFHSCSLCPRIKLEVGVSSTVIFPATQIILSARDGCKFFRQRLRQIFPPSSWVFRGDVGQKLDGSSARLLDETLSLRVHSSLDDDGRSFVDCDFHLPNERWDEQEDDTLMGWVPKGKPTLSSQATKD